MSDYSFEEYLTIKHVMSDITGVADKDWHRNDFHEALVPDLGSCGAIGWAGRRAGEGTPTPPVSRSRDQARWSRRRSVRHGCDTTRRAEPSLVMR